jgi:hypothetical protein
MNPQNSYLINVKNMKNMPLSHSPRELNEDKDNILKWATVILFLIKIAISTTFENINEKFI